MLTRVVRYGVALRSIKHDFGRSTDIIIQHGLMGSAKNFRTLSKVPSISNYANSHLLDARNHGDSPHTDTHTLADLASDIHEYILKEKLDMRRKRLVLMGHSMGALALLQFTKMFHQAQIQSAIKRIILIDIPCTPLIEKSGYANMQHMFDRMITIDMKQELSKINHEIDLYALTPDIAALFKSTVLRSSDGTYRWKTNLNVLARSGYTQIGSFDINKDNPMQWQTPIDLIYGENSGNFDLEQQMEYCSAFPQMGAHSFHCVEGAGHWVHSDKTQAFLGIVEGLLSE